MKGGRGAAEKHEDIPCLSSKLPQVCSLNQYQSSQIFVYLEEEKNYIQYQFKGILHFLNEYQ